MQPKATKIVIFIIGIILLALGLFEVWSALSVLFNSDAATITVMVGPQWIIMALCGAILCVISLFRGKRRN